MSYFNGVYYPSQYSAGAPQSSPSSMGQDSSAQWPAAYNQVAPGLPANMESHATHVDHMAQQSFASNMQPYQGMYQGMQPAHPAQSSGFAPPSPGYLPQYTNPGYAPQSPGYAYAAPCLGYPYPPQSPESSYAQQSPAPASPYSGATAHFDALVSQKGTPNCKIKPKNSKGYMPLNSGFPKKSHLLQHIATGKENTSQNSSVPNSSSSTKHSHQTHAVKASKKSAIPVNVTASASVVLKMPSSPQNSPVQAVTSQPSFQALSAGVHTPEPSSTKRSLDSAMGYAGIAIDTPVLKKNCTPFGAAQSKKKDSKVSLDADTLWNEVATPGYAHRIEAAGKAPAQLQSFASRCGQKPVHTFVGSDRLRKDMNKIRTEHLEPDDAGYYVIPGSSQKINLYQMHQASSDGMVYRRLVPVIGDDMYPMTGAAAQTLYSEVTTGELALADLPQRIKSDCQNEFVSNPDFRLDAIERLIAARNEESSKSAIGDAMVSAIKSGSSVKMSQKQRKRLQKEQQLAKKG